MKFNRIRNQLSWFKIRKFTKIQTKLQVTNYKLINSTI